MYFKKRHMGFPLQEDCVILGLHVHSTKSVLPFKAYVESINEL